MKGIVTVLASFDVSTSILQVGIYAVSAVFSGMSGFGFSASVR